MSGCRRSASCSPGRGRRCSGWSSGSRSSSGARGTGSRRCVAFAAAAPLAFVALPESLQTRFETIINPEVGPKNAQESGEGRLLGLTTGFSLWAANPLNGIGPGAWRPATGSKIESHNLYGQLIGELGTLGRGRVRGAPRLLLDEPGG